MDGRNYFIDTSALFKRYVEEQGSTLVNTLFKQGTGIYVSEITLCEVVSNLRRLVDIDSILNEKEFKVVKDTFLGEAGDEFFTIVEFTPAILIKSLDICTHKYITPLDAIQLASALSLPGETVFVCSDRKLLRVACEWGLETINPMD